MKRFEGKSIVIDTLFKHDEKKSGHQYVNLTFLVCITFLVLQGSFCWRVCMNVKKC